MLIRFNDWELLDYAMAPCEDESRSMWFLVGIEVCEAQTKSIVRPYKVVLFIWWTSFPIRWSAIFQQLSFVCHNFLQCSYIGTGFPFCLSLPKLKFPLKAGKSIDRTITTFITLARSSSKRTFEHSFINDGIGLQLKIRPRTKLNLEFILARKS